MSKAPTISTEELSALIGSENVKILDCSVQMGRPEGDCSRINFHKSHIKGAQFLDLDNLKDMKSDLPFMMPSEEAFIGRMKVLGVRMSDHVVCYPRKSYCQLRKTARSAELGGCQPNQRLSRGIQFRLLRE